MNEIDLRPSSNAESTDDEQQPENMKEGRVTARIEVSHPEHSSLIGPGGSKVREMRIACGCSIHYPDGSPGSSPEPTGRSCSYPHLHANEVSLRGKIPNVIYGCQEVRKAIPFSFVHTLSRNFKLYEAEAQPTFMRLKNIYLIDINMKTENGVIKEVNIRGPQERRTLEGARKILKYLTRGTTDEVTQDICVHPHSQSAMWDLCNGERWLKEISSVNRVTIAFPTPRGDDKQTIVLRGPLLGVAAAWLILMSLLPITVRVFVGRDTDFRRADLERYITSDLQVNFLVPRKERNSDDRQLNTRQYVELRTFEGNMENLSKAYKRLMSTQLTTPKIRIVSVAERLHALGLDFALSVANPRYLNGPSSVVTKTRGLQSPHDFERPTYAPFLPTTPLTGFPYNFPPYGYPNNFYPITNRFDSKHRPPCACHHQEHVTCRNQERTDPFRKHDSYTVPATSNWPTAVDTQKYKNIWEDCQETLTRIRSGSPLDFANHDGLFGKDSVSVDFAKYQQGMNFLSHQITRNSNFDRNNSDWPCNTVFDKDYLDVPIPKHGYSISTSKGLGDAWQVSGESAIRPVRGKLDLLPPFSSHAYTGGESTWTDF